MKHLYRSRLYRSRWNSCALLVIFALFFTACAPAAAPTDPVAENTPAIADADDGPAAEMAPASSAGGRLRPAGTPERGGTLRTAFGVTTAHFDVHQGGSASVLVHMYNGLVRRNLVDGLRTVVPDLAESWEISDDGLTYTFQLREGVTYHDGEPFSAADVVATFERIIDPPAGVVSIFRDEFSMVESVTAADDLTVEFTLSAPRAYFLDLLAAPPYIIYSKKSLEENDYDLREVIAPGTGAFKYVEYQTAERWLLERNEAYWDEELPYVDGLELLHVPAWSDRGTAVLTGQADMSWNVAFETWTEGQNRDDIDEQKLANFGAYWVFFNTDKEPLNDPRVRRAIFLGISRQNMIRAFSSQEQINLTRWVPQGDAYATPPDEIATLPGYREEKDADIEEAKALLADAGYADGFSIELLAAAGPQSELLAPAFQDMLQRNLNIDAEIRIIERALLGEEQQNGNFDLVLDTRGHALSDISPRANLWWRTGGSQNFGNYSNPEFDALLDQIDIETDEAARADLIRQAEDLLDQDPPSVLVGYTFHLPMWNGNVNGLDLADRAFAEWGRVETVWLEQ